MTVSVGVIKRHVAAAFDVSIDLIDGRQAGPAISRPRQVAMYLASTMTRHSLPEIGLMFGGRHHATVIHAVRRVREVLKNDSEFARCVLAVKSGLPNGRISDAKGVKPAARISPNEKLAGEGLTYIGGRVQLLVSPRGKWTMIEIIGGVPRTIACGRGWSVPDAMPKRATPKKPLRTTTERDGTQMRTCLKCLKAFQSTGPGNRRCRPCAKALRDERTGT